jgi:hypothetical protein
MTTRQLRGRFSTLAPRDRPPSSQSTPVSSSGTPRAPKRRRSIHPDLGWHGFEIDGPLLPACSKCHEEDVLMSLMGLIEADTAQGGARKRPARPVVNVRFDEDDAANGYGTQVSVFDPFTRKGLNQIAGRR